jgi:hypothetical protein
MLGSVRGAARVGQYGDEGPSLPRPINPIGAVDRLVHVGCSVAPGSSGAPVLDADMRVRGFVVAGSVDPRQPDTYVYPASVWGAGLASAMSG